MARRTSPGFVFKNHLAISTPRMRVNVLLGAELRRCGSRLWHFRVLCVLTCLLYYFHCQGGENLEEEVVPP